MARQDVFLRELVSNAADACDKKRFLALTNSDAPPEPMKLRINSDKAQQPMEFLPMGLMKIVVILRLTKWWGYVGRWVRIGVTHVIDVIKLWVAGCCFWPEGPLHAIKCNSPSPKVFSWDFPTAYGYCWFQNRCHNWVCLRNECPQIPWFINLQMNEFKFAILGTPPIGKARMMFWYDYSLLPVLAGCQNTHHRGVMNWVDGWQTLKGVRQQLKDLKEFSYSEIYFQVSKSSRQR